MGKENIIHPQKRSVQGKGKICWKNLIYLYTSDDKDSLKGKVKTIGTNFLEYYTSYDDPAFKET